LSLRSYCLKIALMDLFKPDVFPRLKLNILFDHLSLLLNCKAFLLCFLCEGSCLFDLVHKFSKSERYFCLHSLLPLDLSFQILNQFDQGVLLNRVFVKFFVKNDILVAVPFNIFSLCVHKSLNLIFFLRIYSKLFLAPC
jgi:hypothetical protein